MNHLDRRYVASAHYHEAVSGNILGRFCRPLEYPRDFLKVPLGTPSPYKNIELIGLLSTVEVSQFLEDS